MGDRRFDQLTRALGGASTRRGALAALAGMVAGAAGVGSVEAGKKRRRCHPRCPAGQTCRQGTCACDNGGAVCGASCCTPGQRCENGACMVPPAPCILAGAACMGAGAPCCDGFVCGSGQGGKHDVACYVPAGGPCATTADCVYDSTCTGGVCIAMPQPTPEPCRGTIPVSGDPAVDGEALRALAADPDGPDTITLCAGLYRATRGIVVTRDLAIEAEANAGGEVILDGGWSGGDATDGTRVITLTGADVRLTGITLQRGYQGGYLGGCLYANSGGGPTTLTLTRVRVTTCKADVGGGIAIVGIGLPMTLVLHDSDITSNTASTAGGGIYAASSTVTIHGTTRVTGNTTPNAGGGLSAQFSTVAVGGATAFTANTAGNTGGGLYVDGGTVALDGAARVSGNTAGLGGGFCALAATVTLGGTVRVTGNSANGGGAGFFSDDAITCEIGSSPKVCANPDAAAGSGCAPDDACGGALCADSC